MRNTTNNIWRLGAALLLAGSAAVTARADYSSTILSQNPAGYYQLNETVIPSAAPYATNYGTLGVSGQGTYVSAPTTDATGPFSGAVSVGFDGNSQYVNNNWVSGLNTTNFTVELWLNPASPSSFTYPASSVSFDTSPGRSGWYLAQDGINNFGYGSAPTWVFRTFKYQSSAVLYTLHTPITPGWTHLVATFDGTTASLYTNGVLAQSLSSSTYSAYVPNTDQPFTVGARSTLNYNWAGNAALPALYGSALSATRVAAHYAAATTQTAYTSVVQADSPLLYQTYLAPLTAPANNLGTLGSAGNGLYIPDASPAAAGPVPPTYPGFAADNKAVQFDAGGGSVQLPPFNFNTNTVTISGWVNASAVPAVKGAGIIVNGSGGLASGITLDNVNQGLGLGYSWAGDANTFNYSLSGDFGLASLNQNEWDYVALVVKPTEADIYIASPTIGFQSVTNYYKHIVQPFSANTFIGLDPTVTPSVNFLGGVDEVALWNRSLSAGELYTQFGAAVGSLAPRIFTDLLSPSQPVYDGDPLVLSADIGGTPNLSYQWYFNGNPIAAPLGTNSTYAKAFSLATDQGDYVVVVTNYYGSVTSAVASVTGLADTFPTIVAAPVGQTIYPGGTINLSVVAGGGGLTYQWKKNGVAIAGANQSAYKFAGVTSVNAGSYTVTVTNSLGLTNVGPAVIVVPTLTQGSYAYLLAYSNQPTAWWRLDETSVTNGAILYDAEGLHNGSYTNNGGLIAGVAGAISGNNAGTALKFNGDGSYGSIPYFGELSNSKFTLEVWAKQDVAAGNVTAVSSWDANSPASGFDIGTISAGWGAHNSDYAIGQSSPLNSYDPTIYPGQWVHIVLEHGNTGNPSYPWQIYINGNNDGTYIYGDNSTLNSSQPFIIGGRGTGLASILSRYYVGYVDEVAFYNKNLTAAQIQADYAAATAGLPPSFVVQPQSKNVFAGENPSFNVKVTGAAPIALQWLKNGTGLTGATNTSLTLSNVFYNASGDGYSVIASNVNGSVTSLVASVTVNYLPKFVNLTNGLVVHLAFDGNYNDKSGHGNYGIPNNGPVLTNTSVLGSGSLIYQTYTVTNLSATSSNVSIASSDWVDLGTGNGGNNDLQFGAADSFSVSLWVKLASGYVGGDLPFIGTAVGSFNNPGWVLGPTYGTGGWQFGLNDGVQPQATTNNIDISGAANSINDGNWHNFVLTVNRATKTATAYIDAVNQGSVDITGFGSLDDGQPVTIGQDPTHAYPVFPNGASANDLSVWGAGLQSANLDDVGIWRRALSDVEARSIYYAGLNNANSFDTTGPVILSVGTVSGNVRDITWQTGTLQQSTNLFGPWTAVPGATAPFYQFTPTTSGSEFYRVAH